jgi:lactoylglutathione lyase
MKIEHIAIWVKDLEKMKAFYEIYFGGKANKKYRNEKKGFESYFISFDSGARLELMQMLQIPDSKNDIYEQFIGLIHLAISVDSVEDVNTLTEKLRNDAYEIVGEPRWTGDGYYESVIFDPEYNRIEITN